MYVFIHTFICTLPQLFVVGSLLHQVQDGLGQRGVGQWVGLWIHLSISLSKETLNTSVFVRGKQNKTRL